jgi:MFS family permease
MKTREEVAECLVLVAASVSFISIPVFGHISDRIGRKKMHLIGAVLWDCSDSCISGMVDTAIPSTVFALPHSPRLRA